MKISVVIPVYNAEKYLNKCLNSIEKQTIFEELEIIIVNDGSIDNSKKIIEKFSNNHSNVIIINQNNSGVSVARNNGIEKATCKYIAFVDADDYLDNNFFEYLLTNLVKNKCELSICGFNVEYEGSNKSYERNLKGEYIIEDRNIIKEFFIANNLDPNIWNKLYLTSIVKKIRFSKDIHMGEDKWFIFQYLLKIKKMIILPESKYHYFINKSSVCRREFDKIKLEPLKVCEWINEIITANYSDIKALSDSYIIDVKCRIYNEIIASQNYNLYKKEAKILKNEIKSFSILKKIKYSSKKHVITFLLTRFSPKLYMFLKNKMKLQYKK